MPRRVCHTNVSSILSNSWSLRLSASDDPSDIWVLSSRKDCVDCVMVFSSLVDVRCCSVLLLVELIYGDTVEAFLGKIFSGQWVLCHLVCFTVCVVCHRNVGLMPFSLLLCLYHEVPSGVFVDSHLLALSCSANGLLFTSVYMCCPHLFSLLVCICCFW